MLSDELSSDVGAAWQRADDWAEVPLGSIADVRFSSVDKLTYPSEAPVRLCNYTDVYNNDYITENLEFMHASATQMEIDRFGLQVGDVIITKDSETPNDIGVPAVVDYAAPDIVCGYHLGLLRPRGSDIDPTFLSKQLAHHRIACYFGRQANGLTRYGLPLGAVTSAPIWLPDVKEQKSVGSLLRVVDESIAKTEAVIAKLRQVRAGLLHDLLTCGLDENDQLRDPIAHPEQFKETEVGRIPREWEVKPLHEIASSAIDGPFGSNLKTEHYVTDPGVRVVRLQNIGTGFFDDTDRAFISVEHATGLKRHAVIPGDLLVASMGDENHPIARACLYPPHLSPGINKADCFRVRMKPSLALNAFVMLFLNCPGTRRDVSLLGQGVTRDRVRLTTLLTLRVLRPTVEEQVRIVEAVRGMDSRVESEEQHCAKLQLLKSGLMSDLLTGRVRVAENLNLAEGCS